jgi:hypothetical protein
MKASVMAVETLPQNKQFDLLASEASEVSDVMAAYRAAHQCLGNDEVLVQKLYLLMGAKIELSASHTPDNAAERRAALQMLKDINFSSDEMEDITLMLKLQARFDNIGICALQAVRTLERAGIEVGEPINFPTPPPRPHDERWEVYKEECASFETGQLLYPPQWAELAPAA